MPLWCCCGHELILIPIRPKLDFTFHALDRRSMEILDKCPHCSMPYFFDPQCSLKTLRDTPPDFRGEDRI